MLTSSTRPWKHSLTTVPTHTENSLISLYDLFYDNNKKLWIDSTSGEALTGCKLEHDIICLNTSMLKTDGTVDNTQATDITASTWWSNGIDISLPIFDARAKKKVIECNATFSDVPIFYNNKYVIYDKDSALEPQTTNVFTKRGVKIKSIKSDTTITWDTYTPPSIGIYNSVEKSTTLDILLSAPDKAFKSTLVTQDGFDAYNRLFINPYTNFAVDLVMRATGMNLDGLIPGLGDGKLMSAHVYKFTDLKLFWDVSIPNSIAYGVGTEAWFNLLKNTFVWVRAPFYADYIKPDDFEQSLTPESKVVHNELMLSGAGDFKKYDMSITSKANLVGKDVVDNNNVSQYGLGAGRGDETNIDALGRSELSMPYIPKTSPTVDIYTSKLLDEEELLNGIKDKTEDRDLTNYSSKITLDENSTKIQEFLDRKVSGNDMIIRGLPVAAINRDNALDETPNPESLIPPNWFDPENRYSDEYYRKMTKFPTVVPKDGNLYVDGRIIGPTIDEIWIMLKKLTGGRLRDDESDSRATDLDMGIPVGTASHFNNTDTTMTEVPDSEFNFKITDTVSKHGDPIDFKYEFNADVDSKSNLYGQKLTITKFVNQNDTIIYPVYNSLKLLSNSIVKNTNNGNCFIKKGGDDNIETNREITSFTAWKDITTDSNGEGNVITDNTKVSDIDSFWGPRKSAPYSLRELEAMIKGNKYNIITQARFVKENFAVTGGLGKRNEPGKEKYNSAAGSVYQMHQNYNFDVADPNTFYNNDGTDTGFDSSGKTCGARAVIDDPDMRTFEQRLDGHIRYVEEYGKSKTLSMNPEKFSSQDVYLSAAGDWRYVSDHVRIPILRGEWI